MGEEEKPKLEYSGNLSSGNISTVSTQFYTKQPCPYYLVPRVGKLLNLQQVKITSQSDSAYLKYCSSYILSSILQIFAVNRENLVTSKKTTVRLCDASFDLSITVRIKQWDCRNAFDKQKRNNCNSSSLKKHIFKVKGRLIISQAKVNGSLQDEATRRQRAACFKVTVSMGECRFLWESASWKEKSLLNN